MTHSRARSVPDFASMPPVQSETAERLFERWHVALIAGDEPAAAAAVAEFGALTGPSSPLSRKPRSTSGRGSRAGSGPHAETPINSCRRRTKSNNKPSGPL